MASEKMFNITDESLGDVIIGLKESYPVETHKEINKLLDEKIIQQSIKTILEKYPGELAFLNIDFLLNLTRADNELEEIKDHKVLDEYIINLEAYHAQMLDLINNVQEGTAEQKEKVKSKFEDLYAYTIKKINDLKAGISYEENENEQYGGKARKTKKVKKGKKTYKLKKLRKHRTKKTRNVKKSRKQRKTKRRN
jgi:hypothetical protein